MNLHNLPLDKIDVPLGSRSYEILIGPGLIDSAGAELEKRFKTRQVRIVSDQTVADIYLAPLTQSLQQSGFMVGPPVLVPPGESSKSFSQFETIVESLLASRIERSTLLIALGGGVIGDLTGFAAAILLRGVDFVQIPTTLLAQVDSSVGGKTGINSAHGKNLIGAFHQPRLVLTDTNSLRTLPHRELLGGYAETIKYGLIVDPAFFEFLEKDGENLLKGDIDLQIAAIKRSCEIKAEIVARDEREQGDRALLNFGHTFGHALEIATGFGPALSHGEGVAIGSIMAFDLSVRLGLCPSNDFKRVKAAFNQVNLPISPDKSWNLSADSLISLMQTDKKSEAGTIKFILTRGIGKAFVSAGVPQDVLKECLNSFL